jgi:aspartyl protease family protein
LARLGPEPAGLAEGTPVERLKALLQDYNYLVVQSRPGLIERVLITSRKAADGAKSADRAYVETTRLGTHHQVQATLAGPNAVARTVPLLVDTGASAIVLPESMIEELGFAPEALQDGVSQTASGTVPVKIGVLRSVRVGAVSAGDVQVAFIADRRLNGAMLLGMSFLNRFRMTIDDASNELILLAK